eukprot:COSAG01_NODE_31217_length_601_cov_1.354582_1_plen_68_part_10
MRVERLVLEPFLPDPAEESALISVASSWLVSLSLPDILRMTAASPSARRLGLWVASARACGPDGGERG